MPGEPDRRYTADGLEHDERGAPSARDADHRAQLDKRAGKLASYDFGPDWGEASGEGTLALVCFGSASAACREAAALLASEGIAVRVVALRLLAPLQRDALAATLAGCRQLLVVEQNHGGQLCHYLRGAMDFEAAVYRHAVPGPVPLGAAAIASRAREVLAL